MNPRAGYIDDWVAETPESIAARLENAKTAQSQARRTMGFMSIISMMMLFASYNACLSYDSVWILGLMDREFGKETKVADVLTDQALKDWAASRSVQVPLLGIRTSVDDAPVLGTATLLVLALWLLLLTRREHHTVGLLLSDTDTDEATPGESPDARRSGARAGPSYSSGQRWLIFHTVACNSLFVTCDQSLTPAQSFGRNPLRVGDRGIKAWLNRRALRFVSRFFFDFPVIVCSIVFALDRWSYFAPDAFAVGAQTPGVGSPFFWFSLVVFLACWVPLVMCCRRSRLYSAATEHLLRDYGDKLRADLVRSQGTSSRQGLWTRAAVTTMSH